jgi:hypothetical protein
MACRGEQLYGTSAPHRRIFGSKVVKLCGINKTVLYGYFDTLSGLLRGDDQYLRSVK